MRYRELDILRVFALGLILACHYVRSHFESRLDMPLGAVGNLVFFILSGWLLGLQWQTKGCPHFGSRFLAKRIIRLMVPLWLFALPYMGWLIFDGYPLTVKNFCLELSLLNWFDKRPPGMTAFWFLTAIAALYFLLVPLSRRFMSSWIVLGIGLALSVIAQAVLYSVGVRQGYLFIFMLLAVACFLYAHQLLSFVKFLATQVWRFLPLLASIAAFVILWWMFEKDVVTPGAPSSYWAASVVALLIVVTVFALFPEKENRIVSYISKRSYEIFLVHQCVLAIANKQGGVVVYLVGSLVLAELIHLVADKILVKVNNVLSH